MAKSVLTVEGMSCQHCVKAVKTGLGALQGVSDVIVDLSAKTVAVEHDTKIISADKIAEEIENLGYDVRK